MSWLGWIRGKKAKSASDNSGREDAPHPGGRRETDRRIAKLNQQITALPEGPEKIGVYFDRAVAYKERAVANSDDPDDLDKALADFGRVEEVVPVLADVHAHRGECFLRRGDHERAIDSLDRAIALLPVDIGLAVTYLNRGRACAATGDVEAALADFSKAAKIAPEVAEAARKEQVLARQRTQDKAVASRRRERSNTSDFVEQGATRDAQGDVVGALVSFGKALEIAPSADAYYHRGVANCKLRRYSEAIADLTRALELRPRFAAALTERGLAYVERGEIEHGIAEYDAAIAIDPSYGLAHENKGSACLRLERWAAAVSCLDIALRITPSNAGARYHRGIAHEMLGDLSRAIRDFQTSLRSARGGEHVPHAEKRLRQLLARAGDVSAPDEPAPEDLWSQLPALTLDDTVADLVRKAYTEAAFFGLVTFPDGDKTIASFYGKDGLRRHLTEIADAIGPRILALKLGQFDTLLPRPARHPPPPPPAPADGEAERLVEGSPLHLLTHGERILGVFTERLDYHYPDLPTAIFGERPIFDRTEVSRQCRSCQRAVAYFDAVLEKDMLAGFACPHCGASPTEGWVEERMRPGAWSRSGFLGKAEALHEIVARDARTMERLGLGPAQIADALDRLLGGALQASKDRIVRAIEQFEDELRASKMRGVPGLAVLPLGPSLDDLEERLRRSEPLPEHRGVPIDGHDVFLQIYLGYQYCPYTRLRLPWSNDVPKEEVIRRRVKGIVHLTALTDRHLPCRSDLSYRYANLEFLVVRRDNRESLRGSGLLVHLIREHHFFEGEQSPFRLDPEQAARVLGLSQA